MMDTPLPEPHTGLWIITDVPAYRFHGGDGTVINMYTGEPRRFMSEYVARQYAKLSYFKGYKLKDLMT